MATIMREIFCTIEKRKSALENHNLKQMLDAIARAVLNEFDQ